MKISSQDIQFCQKIMAKSGPTYYWATKLFPKKIRQSTYILYAFYRVPDDIVDLEKENKKLKLEEWVKEWSNLVENPTPTNLQQANPVLRASYIVHQIYKIPFHHSQSFLKAMLQDLTKKRYQTYQELKDYMYGSAAVVGIMMTYLINPSPTAQTLKQAEDLGYAMQLTNFIRDIKEDVDERDRIYLPEDELKAFQITSKNIQNHDYPPRWEAFVKEQLLRTNQLYKSGFQGLKKLPFHARFCIRLAAVMYMDYNRQIIQSNFRVYDSTYKLTTARKIFCLIKTVLNLTQPPKWPKQS
jgi:phytoene synthase